MYSAVGPNAELVAELDDLLSGLRDTDSSDAFIRDAAHRWADAVDPADRGQPAADVQQAVDRAVDALTEVGFDAQLSPIGDTITLRACPYASLVRDHPVICRIHTALLQDLFDRSGQQVSVTEMQVGRRPAPASSSSTAPTTHPS